jgi:hypothetical protein
VKTINFRSVLFTGFICGIIILISALSMVPAVGNKMDEILASRGLPPLSKWAMVFFCFVSICNGILLVFFYSLLKQLFVSKLKTVIVSSLIVFFFIYFLSSASLVAYGFMPLKFTIIGTAWGLGELLLAGLVSSKLYKEVKQVK